MSRCPCSSVAQITWICSHETPRQYLLPPLSLFQGAAQGLFTPLVVVGTNQDDGCKVKVKVAQSCPTLFNTTDYTVHGILQAWILEWVAFPFSRGSFQPRGQIQVSCIAGRFFINWANRESPKLLLNDSVKPLQGMAVLRVVEKNLYQDQHIFS